MDLYGSYVRFHGRQHFRLKYKDIDQLIKLPQVERDLTVVMIALSKHLTFGRTMHHFLLIQLETLREARVKINMEPSEIRAKYGSKIEAELSEESPQIFVRLFEHIGGVNKIVSPGDFTSAVDPRAQAISCSVRASQGLLYPMATSLIFVNKPIMLISHKDIKYIEFQRCGDKASGPGKFFDISVQRVDSSPDLFKNIDKLEYQKLISYFRKAGLKMRLLNADSGQVVDMSDLRSDEIDEEIRQSQQQEEPVGIDEGRGVRGKRRAAVQAAKLTRAEGNDSDLNDEDSDDVSFDSAADGSGSGSDDEDGELDMDDEIGEDEIDKAQLAKITKEQKKNKDDGGKDKPKGAKKDAGKKQKK